MTWMMLLLDLTWNEEGNLCISDFIVPLWNVIAYWLYTKMVMCAVCGSIDYLTVCCNIIAKSVTACSYDQTDHKTSNLAVCVNIINCFHRINTLLCNVACHKLDPVYASYEIIWKIIVFVTQIQVYKSFRSFVRFSDFLYVQ
jgi:hypothetical protein